MSKSGSAREDIKRALVEKLLFELEEEPSQSVRDAFDNKAESVIRELENEIFTKEAKEELKEFRAQLTRKSRFEKYLEKTAFIVPLVITIMFGYIFNDLRNKHPEINILEGYGTYLTIIVFLLIVWLVSSLYFVFRKE